MFFACWIPLVFYFVTCLFYVPSYRNTILLVLTCMAQMFSSAKYSLLLTIIVPLYCLLLLFFSTKKISSYKKSFLFLCMGGLIVIGMTPLYLLLFGSVSAESVTYLDIFKNEGIMAFYLFFKNEFLSIFVIGVMTILACLKKTYRF